MHLERGSRLALVAMFPVLVLASCEAEDDGEEVSRGGWGQPCYSDQTCDYGLVCGFYGDRFACDWSESTCTPDCAGKQCGDNGCGGTCGTCTAGYCVGGTCKATCTPSCTGKTCGSDGCGGSCGTCEVVGRVCSGTAKCVGGCQPSCVGSACGYDKCSACGACPLSYACDASGKCVAASDLCIDGGQFIDSCDQNPLNVFCTDYGNFGQDPTRGCNCGAGGYNCTKAGCMDLFAGMTTLECAAGRCELYFAVDPCEMVP